MMVMMLLLMFFVRCKLIQLCCQYKMRIGTYKPEKGWIIAYNVPK